MPIRILTELRQSVVEALMPIYITLYNHGCQSYGDGLHTQDEKR